MKNTKLIFTIIFTILYAVGIFFGGLGQARSGKQEDMYSYITGATSAYTANTTDSIKSVAVNNLKLLICLLAGGCFVFGPILLSAVIFCKGFSAGFAITAVLRLYGIKGLLLCGANILSALFLIPAILYYGSVASQNVIVGRHEKKYFWKRYLFIALFITAVICADSFARGYLSSVFMRFSEGVIKNM